VVRFAAAKTLGSSASPRRCASASWPSASRRRTSSSNRARSTSSP